MSKKNTFIPATPSEIAAILASQNYTFTPDQIANKSIQITRKNGKTVTARIFKSQVDSLMNMITTIGGSSPSVEQQRLIAALNTMSLSSQRGREKLTREKLERETPRFYSVAKSGHAVVPVGAWFGFDAKDGVKRKVSASYRDDGILISYSK
jgi:hypothetical protein